MCWYCNFFLFLIFTSVCFSAQPPVFSFYENKTAIADIPLVFQPPELKTGDTPIIWSLIGAPEGITINASTGQIVWIQPVNTIQLYVQQTKQVRITWNGFL